MSHIQWTDRTLNPYIVMGGGHWCRKISPGCANCYAETMNLSRRFDWASKLRYQGSVPSMTFDEEQLKQLERARNSYRWFLFSMTDIFGEWVPLDIQMLVLDTIARSPRQTVQLLTKRPEIAADAVKEWCDRNFCPGLPENCWLGVSVENQQMAKERLPVLLNIPGGLKWASCEPLLSTVSLNNYLGKGGLDWVVVGGESGSGARECLLSDITYIRETCHAYDVPLFIKQLGRKPIVGRASNVGPIDRTKVAGITHAKGGNPDEWPAEFRVQEFPKVAAIFAA